MLLPLVSAAAPILLVPVVSMRFGAEGWGLYAIGQSVGAFGAVLVELGWGLSGTQRVARQSPAHRRRTLAFAAATQCAVLPVAVLICTAAAAAVAPDHRWFVGSVAVVAAAGAVNGVWFFIGRGRPADILRADTAPRVVALLLAAGALALGAPIGVVPIALGIGALSAVVLTARVTGMRITDFRGLTAGRIMRLLRAQAAPLVARAASAGYIALPTALVAGAAPHSVPLFAAVDRLQRWLLTGLQPIPNTMQRWVGAPWERSDRQRRALLAVVVSGVIGTGFGVSFALVAPVLSTIVFADQVHVPIGLAVFGGVIIALVTTSRATGGLLLVALRAVPGITASALIGCAVGVPLIIVGAQRSGAAGALAGIAATELVVLAVQSVVAAIAIARRRSRSPSRPPGGRRAGARPRVVFVRVDDPEYPRNARLRAAAVDAGCEVTMLVRSHHPNGARRLLTDVIRICTTLRRYDVYVVAEFSLRFAPLVGFIARLNRARCVVDCFVQKEETVIDDHALAGPRSVTALLARAEDRLAIGAAHVVLTDTQFRASAIRRRVGTRARPIVMPLPVGAPPWAHPAGTPADDTGQHIPDGAQRPLRVLFYGSFIPLHGVPTIIEAAALAGPAVHLTLLGDVRERDTRARLVTAGIAARCTIADPVPAASLADVIADHDVVLGVFGTSVKANSVIANKVWQGLACGKPVVTQRSPALAEIRDLVADQLIEVAAGDPEALAAALIRLVAARPNPSWGATGERLERYVRRQFEPFAAILQG